MAALTYEQLIEELKKQIYKPVYFLMGEESYFIDAVSDYIEENVLNEDEKSFNLTVTYGKDVDLATIVSMAKRYPMMSNYQIVIIKEAQNIKSLDAGEIGKKVNPLLSYVQSPLNSTILVICYKGKKLEKNRKIYKAIDKAGVIFESKKIYETKLPSWIVNQFKIRGKSIDTKAASLMADFIGNNLSSIINEINKILIFLEKEQTIKIEHVEKLIGVSKDFNNTELLKAIGTKNVTQANRILLYFQSDPRQHPVQQTIVWLFEYFSKIILYKDFQNLSDNEIASKIGVPPYFLDDYKLAAKNYSRNQLIQNIHIIREYDMKSKGVDSVADGHELLKEMVFKLMYGI